MEGGSVVDGLEGGIVVNGLEGGSVVDGLEGGIVVVMTCLVIEQMRYRADGI